jgi:hypothetical protein
MVLSEKVIDDRNCSELDLGQLCTFVTFLLPLDSQYLKYCFQSYAVQFAVHTVDRLRFRSLVGLNLVMCLFVLKPLFQTENNDYVARNETVHSAEHVTVRSPALPAVR